MDETLTLAIENLKKQKARTSLTLLGVIIGITLLVSMITAGDGLKYTIEQMMEQMGPGVISIVPSSEAGLLGMMTAGVIFNEGDVETVKSVPGVKVATGYYYAQYYIEKDDELRGCWIAGIEPEAADELFLGGGGWSIYAGRSVKKGERGSALAGWLLYKEAFDRPLKLREKVKVGDKEFKIVGIIEEIGSEQDDTAIWMPIEDAWEVFGSYGKSGAIMAKSADAADPTRVAEDIRKRLKKYRGTEDFEVLTTEQLLEQIGSIMKILTVVLTGIGSISLLVGGIGIMNTMLMSVAERTKEIGVMKAIGATRQTIVQVFLLEALIIALVGGTIGLAAGYGVSKIIAIAVTKAAFKMQIRMTVWTALLSFGFAALVGALSGIYPAYKAAKLNPVDALRK